MILRITSPRNDRIKFVQKLSRRRYRQRERLFVAEGLRLMHEALESGAAIHSVYYAGQDAGPAPSGAHNLNDILGRLPQGVPVYEVPPSLMRQVANTDTPQGVLAVIHMPVRSLEECLAPVRCPSLAKGYPLVGTPVSADSSAEFPPLVVLVDGLQDPGNLGTIIRAAEALMAGGVVLGEGTVDAYNPKAVRATMGAIFRFPVCEHPHLPSLVARLREEGFHIVAAVARGGMPVFRVPLAKTSAIIFGNEGAGIRDELLAMADSLATIPMPGGTESLNAGMAASIILYEALRQRLLNQPA